MSKYSVIVVSAPSGAGKSTLNSKLVKEVPEVELSISYTTRKPRSGERHGVEYYFIEEELFRQKIAQSEFLEWAHVHTAYYGTSHEELQRIRNKGHIPLLEIDVQGWLNIADKVDHALPIFITTPSLKVLWDRLTGRNSESLAQRWIRFQNAIKEIEKSINYSAVIVNDDLTTAYEELKSCVLGDDNALRRITEKNRSHCEKLLAEFKQASWIETLRTETEVILGK